MSYKLSRAVLGGLAAFTALTAIPSAVFVIPYLPVEWLRAGPFTDYSVPALALGVVVGGSAVIAFAGALLSPAIAAATSMLAGLMIAAFELVEIGVVGLAIAVHGTQYVQSWLQIVYLAVGAAQIIVAYRMWRGTAPFARHVAARQPV